MPYLTFKMILDSRKISRSSPKIDHFFLATLPTLPQSSQSCEQTNNQTNKQSNRQGQKHNILGRGKNTQEHCYKVLLTKCLFTVAEVLYTPLVNQLHNLHVIYGASIKTRMILPYMGKTMYHVISKPTCYIYI